MKIPQGLPFNTTGKTAADLQDFLGKVGDNAKIIGKKNSLGETVLFVKPEGSTLMARLSGKADARKDLAREAIADLIGKTQTRLKDKLEGNAAKALFGGLQDSIAAAPRGKFESASSVTVSELRKVADVMVELEKTASGLEPPKPKSTSFEKQVSADLVAKTSGQRPIDKNGSDVDLPDIIITEQTDSGPVTKTFVPTSFVTSGGFADIFVYENANDPNEKYVLKAPQDVGVPPSKLNATAQKGREIFEQEIVKHLNVGGGDNAHPNVLQAKAGVRLPDGSPALLLAYAPGGNLDDFSRGLKASEGDGPGECPKLLADVLRAGMIEGTTSGLAHLDGLNIAHRDIKALNILLDDKGNPLVSDLGEAVDVSQGEDLSLTGFHNENPFNLSPELLRRRDDAASLKDGYSVLTQNETAALRSALAKIDLPEKTKQAMLDKLSLAINKRYGEGVEASLHVNGRDNDKWSIGTLIAEIVTGNTILPHMGAFKDEVAQLVKNRAGRSAVGTPDGSGKLPDGALVASTGNPAFDQLMNVQMSEDPAKRLTPQEILRTPASRMPAMNSDAVKDFRVVQMQMGKLRNAIAEQQSSIDFLINGYAGRPIQPHDQQTIDNAKTEIARLKGDITTLTPRYETAKKAALEAISLAQLEDAPRTLAFEAQDLGALRKEVAAEEQALDQLGEDARSLSDIAFDLGQSMSIRG